MRTARERSGPPMPDRTVEPEDLWFVAQRLARLADELAEPVPYSYVIGQVQAGLGSLDAPSAQRKRREEGPCE